MRYILIAVLLAVGTVVFAQQPADPVPDVDALLGEPPSAEDKATGDAGTDAPPPAESEEPAAEKDAGESPAPVEPAETTEGEPGAEEAGAGKAGEEGAAEEASDDADLAPEMPSWQEVLDDVLHSGAIGLLLEGGFFMWPILLMGIVATGVMIERYRSLKMLSTDTAALRGEVADLLRAGASKKR